MNPPSPTRTSSTLLTAPLSLLLLLSACRDDASPTCEEGAAGCACATTTDCGGGLECLDGICGAATNYTVSVSSSDARSCEFLVVADGAQVRDVSFVTGVTGTFVTESPRTAVALFTNADAAFPSGAVSVDSVGDALSLARARCFDAAGAVLSGDAVTLQ